jgi:hypothetical protein
MGSGSFRVFYTKNNVTFNQVNAYARVLAVPRKGAHHGGGHRHLHVQVGQLLYYFF